MRHLPLPQVISDVRLIFILKAGQAFSILVTFTKIESIPFPAVTVCAPNSRKWSALVEALDLYDKEKLFKNLILHYDSVSDGAIIPHLHWIYFYTSTLKEPQFSPTLIVDHELPNKLGLLSIEKEVFYLIHYACSILGWKCLSQLFASLSLFSLKLAMKGSSREETAESIRNWICQQEIVDCSGLNNLSWNHCLNLKEENVTSSFETWCNDCDNLS